MTSENQIEQFQELLDNYSDGIISVEDMERLYLFISSDSEMLKEFREHLIMEEALSQYLSETRHGDNFVEAFKTRLHAETSSRQFVKDFEKMLDGYKKKGKISVKIRKKSSTNKKRPFQNPKKSIAFRLFAYAASFIAVFGVLFYFLKIKDNQVEIKAVAKIDEVKGAVSLVRDGKSHKALRGISVFPKDQLMIEAGNVSFVYPDSTRIKILANSKLSVNKGYKAKNLTLTYGKIEAYVAKQDSYYSMTVSSPTSQITVVGTVFNFQNINNTARLEVIKGKVRFMRLYDKKSLDISAGEFAEIAENIKFEIKRYSPDILKANSSKLHQSAHLVWSANASTHDLTFNGIDEYLEIADRPSLDFGSGNFTVACWVKKLESSSGDGWDNIWGVNKWNTGAKPGTNEWSIGLSSDGDNDIPRFGIQSGTRNYTAESTENLTIGQWHHLVGTRSGSEIHLYVDGQLVGSKSVGNASVNNVGRNLYVANSALNDLLTKGDFDDIRIYNIALSAAEVNSLYKAGH